MRLCAKLVLFIMDGWKMNAKVRSALTRRVIVGILASLISVGGLLFVLVMLMKLRPKAHPNTPMCMLVLKTDRHTEARRAASAWIKPINIIPPWRYPKLSQGLTY